MLGVDASSDLGDARPSFAMVDVTPPSADDMAPEIACVVDGCSFAPSKSVGGPAFEFVVPLEENEKGGLDCCCEDMVLELIGA